MRSAPEALAGGLACVEGQAKRRTPFVGLVVARHARLWGGERSPWPTARVRVVAHSKPDTGDCLFQSAGPVTFQHHPASRLAAFVSAKS